MNLPSWSLGHDLADGVVGLDKPGHAQRPGASPGLCHVSIRSCGLRARKTLSIDHVSVARADSRHRVLTDSHNANAQTFHGFCRSEVRMSASRSTAGSVISGYRGRNTVSVVMRAALGVDCNEPSAVGTARNWLPADASKQ